MAVLQTASVADAAVHDLGGSLGANAATRYNDDHNAAWRAHAEEGGRLQKEIFEASAALSAETKAAAVAEPIAANAGLDEARAEEDIVALGERVWRGLPNNVTALKAVVKTAPRPASKFYVAWHEMKSQAALGLEHPFRAPLFQGRIFTDDRTTVDLAKVNLQMLEAEFAFIMRSDLPPRESGPYTAAEVWDAVALKYQVFH